MANNFDADFIKRSPPKSASQSRTQFSNDKIKTLTKAKIQEYIESFFRAQGENRDLLSIVSPRSISYNIERSFDPQTDPTQRKLQVARIFSELRNILPAILILDGGVVPMPHMGLISDAYAREGNWVGHFPVVRNIPITIIAATRDVESADELASVLSLLFNELRNMAGGSYMRGKPEEGDTWVITLPVEGVGASAVNESEVAGDPIERIFYSEMSFEARYEDVVRVQQKFPTVEPGTVVYNPSPNLATILAPQIVFPDSISINDQYTVLVKNIENHMRVVISDASIATISYNMVLTPRKFGKFKIQVINSKLDPQKRVVAEKEVEVV